MKTAEALAHAYGDTLQYAESITVAHAAVERGDRWLKAPEEYEGMPETDYQQQIARLTTYNRYREVRARAIEMRETDQDEDTMRALVHDPNLNRTAHAELAFFLADRRLLRHDYADALVWSQAVLDEPLAWSVRLTAQVIHLLSESHLATIEGDYQTGEQRARSGLALMLEAAPEPVEDSLLISEFARQTASFITEAPTQENSNMLQFGAAFLIQIVNARPCSTTRL